MTEYKQSPADTTSFEPSTIADIGDAELLQDIFSNPRWIASNNRVSYPNLIYYCEKDGKKIGVVVAFRDANGQGNDFALGKSGLDYVLQAEAEHRLDVAFVVLAQREADGSRKVIASKRAVEVYEPLRHIASIAGKLGVLAATRSDRRA